MVNKNEFRPKRYQIQKPLDESNKVFLAEDTKLKREVVLKTISKKGKHEDLQRFRRELSFHAKLDHPYIIPIFDSFETENEITIVMKYVEGQSLKEKLRSLKLNEFFEIFKKILRALAYVHSEKLLHRDIKPSNILLDKENHPYLIDFGIVKALESDLTDVTKVGTFVGTQIYASPEQYLGQELSPASDIYSLGIILYEKLSGKPLTEVISKEQITRQSFTPNFPNLPKSQKRLKEICLKMIEKDPKQRYQSCDEILRDLESYKSFNQSNTPKKDKLILVLLSVLIVAVAYIGYNLLKIKSQFNVFSSNMTLENNNSLYFNRNSQEKPKEENSQKENLKQNDLENSKTLIENPQILKKPSTTEPSYIKMYTTREVNLREEPTQNSRRIKRLKKGVEVWAIPVDSSEIPSDALQDYPWYFDKKRNGYIYGKYLYR